MENVVGIVVGFVLTTIAGGWWAARLQERSWVRQNDAQLRQAERERADAACQELLSLMDRRLYRMQRLYWAASGASVDVDELERRRLDYVAILFAWNDRLNTNLALVGSHFGDEARAYLDRLYEHFKGVGQELEAIMRATRAGEDPTPAATAVGREFDGREPGSLNDQIYQFGLLLLGQLRDGRVGRRASEPSAPRGDR